MDNLLGLSPRGTNGTQSEICAFQRCRILLFLRLRHFPEEKWERIDGKSRPEFPDEYMGDAEHRWTLNTHFFLFSLITAIKGPERQYALNVYLACPKSEVIFYTKYQYSLCYQHSSKLLKAKSLCTK